MVVRRRHSRTQRNLHKLTLSSPNAYRLDPVPKIPTKIKKTPNFLSNLTTFLPQFQDPEIKKPNFTYPFPKINFLITPIGKPISETPKLGLNMNQVNQKQ